MIAFIDASFLIALFHKNDGFHPRAIKIIEKLEKKSFSPVTSNIVIAEAANFIFRNNGPKPAEKFFKTYKQSDIREFFLNKEVFIKGYKLLFAKKSKRGLNFFDCLHLATLNTLGIKTILTFDRGFKKEVNTIGV